MPSRTDLVERHNIWVMHTWEAVQDYPDLMRFWDGVLRAKFSQIEPELAQKDLDNYYRICTATSLSLERFNALYQELCHALPNAFRQDALEQVSEAVLCRDEPQCKELLWRGADYYWHMVWTMG